MRVGPHEIVGLPTGTFHLFIKCVDWKKLTRDTIEPMMGYVGDNTYLGSETDADEIQRNIQYAYDTQLELREQNHDVISFIELGIFSLFNIDDEGLKDDAPARLAKQALKPLYAKIYKNEIDAKACIPKNEKIQIICEMIHDKDVITSDYVCTECSMGIVNLFALCRKASKSSDEIEYYCCCCFPKHIHDKILSYAYRFLEHPVAPSSLL
jgi:hypothetical protein